MADVQGRVLAPLRDGEEFAGRQVIAWDARAAGKPAAPGVCFARLRAAGGQWVRRIVVQR